IPFIRITPPTGKPLTLTAVNFESGGIFLESDVDLHLSPDSFVLNSREQLGFFEIAGLPVFPRSFKTEGSQSIVLRTGGSLTLHGILTNQRGSIRLEAPGGLVLGSAAMLSATDLITLEAPSTALDADSRLGLAVPGGNAAGAAGGLLVAGNLMLGGAMSLSVVGGPQHTILPTDTITIVTAAAIDGAFSNPPAGARLLTVDRLGSFVVNYGPGSPFPAAQVVLSAFRRSGAADGDNDVALADLAELTRGLSGPGEAIVAGCELLDADGDGRVALADFAAQQVAFTGQ
ncbi:MAG: hypothetical protein Q7R41_13665, partial [Phycisphaerales bacterium]|nr:hypothetical protein [Phycisphaerales bacterium]